MADNNPLPAPMPIYIPMSIPVYKAESSQDVEIFLQQYEGMTMQMRFTNEMKASCFINYIGGEEVIRFWQSLSDEEKLDYREIKAAFLSHFKKVKPDPAESYTKLSNRKLKWDENNIKKCEKLDTYFRDIRDLVSKCDSKVRESQVLIAYSNLHPLFREYVELKAPSLSTLTMSELEEITKRKEGYYRDSNSSSVSDNDSKSSNPKSHSSDSSKASVKSSSSMNSKGKDLSHIQCFTCFEYGHYSSRCPNKNSKATGKFSSSSSSSSSSSVSVSPPGGIKSEANKTQKSSGHGVHVVETVDKDGGNFISTSGRIAAASNDLNNQGGTETKRIGPSINSTNPSYFLSLQIEGSPPLLALLDTGAGMSLCSRELFASLPPHVRERPLLHSRMDVNNVSGDKLIIDGVLIASVGLLGPSSVGPISHIPLTIYVSNMVSDSPLILGNDFVNQFVRSLDVSNKKLILRNGSEIPFVLAEKNIAFLDVVSVGKHIIPPLCKINLPARVATVHASGKNRIVGVSADLVGVNNNSGKINHDQLEILRASEAILFEPIVNLFNEEEKQLGAEILSGGVQVVTSLVNISEDGDTSVVIENNTLLKCCVENGFKLGTAEAVTPIDSNRVTIEVKDTNTGKVYSTQSAPDEIDASPFSITPFGNENHSSRSSSFDTISLSDNVIIPWKNIPLSDEEKVSLLTLLREEVDIFAENPKAPNTTNIVEHRIDTGSHSPVFQHPYRVSPVQSNIFEREIKTMLDNNIIIPSNSPWSSPAVLVEKPDKTIRFCIDFRRLNSITKPDRYPIPRIDDTLDALGQAVYFSTLDLASGFWQIKVAADDREKTAFSTRQGHFEFNVMPFGLRNAPATFQRLMDFVLAGLLFVICLVYLDDIIIFSRTIEEHLQHLSAVFDRLRKAGLSVKGSKCYFALKEIKYLGHIIGNGIIKPDPAKIEVLKSYPKPRNQTEIRIFLGFVGYYRDFIEALATLAGPLYKLLKKNAKFDFNSACQYGFDTIIQRLIDAVLALPDYNKPFIIYCDANLSGLGAILCQKIDDVEKTIVYASKTLNDAQTRYHTTERECLAVKFGCEQFRPYIYGQQFIIVTDHSALRWLINHKDVSSRLFRWALYLQEYDFIVQHRGGTHHANADTLSRIPGIIEDHKIMDEKEKSVVRAVQLNSVIRESKNNSSSGNSSSSRVPLPVEPQELQSTNINSTTEDDISSLSLAEIETLDIKTEQRKDKLLLVLIQALENKDDNREVSQINIPTSNPYSILEGNDSNVSRQANELEKFNINLENYSLMEGILVRHWSPQVTKPHPSIKDYRVVVPLHLRAQFITAFHDEPLAGHLGLQRTYDRIRSRFYWVNMYKDIELWIRTCSLCNAKKRGYNLGKMKLGSFPVVTQPWERVSVDLMGPLPETRTGNKYILTCTDHFTCWVEGFALPNMKTTTIAQVFIEEIVCRYGAPRFLLSDRGTNFIGSLAKDIYSMLNIKKINTTPYHPQANGRTERFNYTLATMLSMYVNDNQLDWDAYLPYVLFAYRTSIHSLLNESPYYLLYGRLPLTPLDSMLLSPLSGEGNQHSGKHEIYLNDLQARLQMAHDLAKKHHQSAADKTTAFNADLDPATLVHYQIGDKVLVCEPSSKKGISRKLYKPFKGPYLITESYGNGLNYQVQKLKKNGQVSTQSKLVTVNVKFLKPYHSPAASQLRQKLAEKEEAKTQQLLKPVQQISPISLGRNGKLIKNTSSKSAEPTTQSESSSGKPRTHSTVPSTEQQLTVESSPLSSSTLNSSPLSGQSVSSPPEQTSSFPSPNERRRSSRVNKGQRNVGAQWINTELISFE
jgi:hypothetical protein